jgi:hypothetical protein
MSVKEMVLQELETLDDGMLQDVAAYLSFLKFRARQFMKITLPDPATLAQLYGEAAQEDRELTKQGMGDYQAGLVFEDLP